MKARTCPMVPTLVGMVMALSISAQTGNTFAQGCEPEGDVSFVCGPVSPEDLVPVPGLPWVIAAGMEEDGQLYGVDTRSHTSTVLFPTTDAMSRLDGEMFAACPGPVVDQFQPHGLSLRPGSGDVHTLYVVRHGGREAIEVFELDAGGETPSVTWVGCAVAPDGVRFNSVTALPDGGIAATNFQRPVGEVWEWQTATGWTKVPGSETSGPNGLVSSPDGDWLYIGGWGTQSLIRLSRGAAELTTDAVDVGFHIDNVRWAPDGSLLAAGHRGDTPEAIFQCLSDAECTGITSRVARVDPETLEAREIVRYPSTDDFILGTVAIQVGDEIWVGGIGGTDRIVRVAAPAQ